MKYTGKEYNQYVKANKKGRQEMRQVNKEWGIGELFGCLGAVKSFITGDSALEESRENALTFEKGKLIVDTCYTIDTEYWETGITDEKYESGNDWVIVEEYENEKEAKIGHKKWVKLMTAKKIPKSLKSIQEYSKVYNLK